MANGFLNIVFPDSISSGATGGDTYITSVIQNGSGREQRVSQIIVPIGKWDVSHGVKRVGDFARLQSFFRAARGKAFTWKFKNWIGNDFQLNNEPAAPIAGSATTFQICKTYSNEWGVNQSIRIVTKPNTDGMQVLVNGVVTAAAIDDQTGIITLAAAPADGAVVSVIGQYWCVCRFDTDQMLAKMEQYNAYSWGQIPVVEVLS